MVPGLEGTLGLREAVGAGGARPWALSASQAWEPVGSVLEGRFLTGTGRGGGGACGGVARTVTGDAASLLGAAAERSVTAAAGGI